ncbi:MAG: ABC transporter substrate-binding protein [Bacteroidales bacterium]|nr:ABC transporter substrate-binding protein [Bacteroidales bacterium]
MKRYLLSSLVFLLLLPAGASAQWYLFPGGRHAKDSSGVNAADNVFIPVGDDEVVTEEEGGREEVHAAKVSLILPLKSTGTPNSNFLDFYSGVLMAANSLSSSDKPIELSVYDSTVGMPSISELEQSDLIIGPVNYDDVQRLLPRARGKLIISPLDPKVASLTPANNVVQAPSGWEAQVDELVRWIASDKRGGDAVILLQSADERDGEMTKLLALKLSEAGIPYSISSTPTSFEGTVKGTCRFVVASEKDDFCSAAVREIALMNLKGTRNAVYSTSRIRSISDLEVESLHAASAHIAATYYANPSDAKVKRFAQQYKSLFKGEPGQWVYQGYDLMNYFGTLLEEEGEFTTETIASKTWNGLQTDFKFDESGKNNTAVRRLLYNANNTITLVR